MCGCNKIGNSKMKLGKINFKNAATDLLMYGGGGAAGYVIGGKATTMIAEKFPTVDTNIIQGGKAVLSAVLLAYGAKSKSKLLVGAGAGMAAETALTVAKAQGWIAGPTDVAYPTSAGGTGVLGAGLYPTSAGGAMPISGAGGYAYVGESDYQ